MFLKQNIISIYVKTLPFSGTNLTQQKQEVSDQQ